MSIPWGLAIAVGVGCLALQFVLQWLCTSSLLPDGWWRKQPVFLAHQAIALPLMVYCAVVGTKAWFFPAAADVLTASTFDGRVNGHMEISEFLCAIILGACALWDIPMTFHKSLYSVASMGHHVGLAVMAVLCMRPYVQYYVPFFLGVVEISSIPLQFVDLFHPKHFVELTETYAALAHLNTLSRTLFLISFILLRTFYFPYTMIAGVWPDLYAVLNSGVRGADFSIALVVSFFSVTFTVLQLYWSYLLLKQVSKAAKGDSEGRSHKVSIISGVHGRGGHGDSPSSATQTLV